MAAYYFRRLQRRRPLLTILLIIVIIVCIIISAASYNKWLATMMNQLKISSSSSLYHPPRSSSNGGGVMNNKVGVKSQPSSSSTLDNADVFNNIISSPSSLSRASVLPTVTNNATTLSATKVTKPTNVGSSSNRKKRRRRRSAGMHICHCLAADSDSSSNTNDNTTSGSSSRLQHPPPPYDNDGQSQSSPPSPPSTDQLSSLLLRWLHIPKTGTSFISTLWNIITSSKSTSSSSSSSNNNDRDRYIDLNVHSHSCDNYYYYNNTTNNVVLRYYSMYDFVLMRRYPWEMYGVLSTAVSGSAEPTTTTTTTTTTTNRTQQQQQQQFSNLSLSFGLVGGTQHQPLSKISYRDDNFTNLVATFFREPKERIISAYYDNRHANGLTTEQYKDLYKSSSTTPPISTATTKTKTQGPTFQPCIYHSNNNASSSSSSTVVASYTNPLACFANYPGMTGCAARMLTGETCADGIHRRDGTDNILNALDAVTNELHFIGLTEEWDESICQFHHSLLSRHQHHNHQRWMNHNHHHRHHHPQQGEFSNVHSSPTALKNKMHDIEHHLRDNFVDVADTIIYEVAKLRFERMVTNSGGRCHRYMTWDEIDKYTQELTDDDYDDDDDDTGNNGSVNNILFSLPKDEDGYVCEPMSCSDLGKQCGEYDDKCGKTVICGLCDPGRTGLPSTWRVKCVDGQCVDYCPPWDDRGVWSLSTPSSSSSSFTNEDQLPLSPSSSSEVMMKKIGEIFEISQDEKKQQYLSPVNAIMICEIACNKTMTHHEEWLVESFIHTGLCHCGTTANILSKNLTIRDFSKAHDMNEACNLSKARIYAVLTANETQPICCPYIDQQVRVPTNWRKLGILSKFNVEGEYYDHIILGCGAFVECELVARQRGAELAVFDLFNKICYLARNVFDIKNMYTITKDNAMRYAIDLRK